jgi:hypothetical protein
MERLDQHVKNFHPDVELASSSSGDEYEEELDFNDEEDDEDGMSKLLEETLNAEGGDVLLSMTFVEKILEEDDVVAVAKPARKTRTVDPRYLAQMASEDAHDDDVEKVAKKQPRRRYPCQKDIFNVDGPEEEDDSDESEASFHLSSSYETACSDASFRSSPSVVRPRRKKSQQPLRQSFENEELRLEGNEEEEEDLAFSFRQLAVHESPSSEYATVEESLSSDDESRDPLYVEREEEVDVSG